jgi:hypothetical protein
MNWTDGLVLGASSPALFDLSGAGLTAPVALTLGRAGDGCALFEVARGINRARCAPLFQLRNRLNRAARCAIRSTRRRSRLTNARSCLMRSSAACRRVHCRRAGWRHSSQYSGPAQPVVDVGVARHLFAGCVPCLASEASTLMPARDRVTARGGHANGPRLVIDKRPSRARD